MMNKFGSQLGEFLNDNNISIKEFANRINTSSKNLIDIIKGKIELSQNMIYNISFVTSIPVSYIENVESNYKLELTLKKFLEKENITIKEFINKFSYKEFSKKYNFKFSDERNDYSVAKGILKYLRITDPSLLYKEDNTIFYKSKNDKIELLVLWLERCYKIVSEQKIGEYKKENIDAMVDYIRKCAAINVFNEEKLITKFNENGIYLAIEDDLNGSKIRGAFKVLNDKPAIYITRKYKRYADVYFALLHELAHCKSDFNRAKNGSLVSFQNEMVEEDYEMRADKTAFNWMVDEHLYKKIKGNYDDINKFDVVKSFFVYRLANDKIISYSSKLYQENNKIISK